MKVSGVTYEEADRTAVALAREAEERLSGTDHPDADHVAALAQLSLAWSAIAERRMDRSGVARVQMATPVEVITHKGPS